jgi:hypothetical protein
VTFAVFCGQPAPSLFREGASSPALGSFREYAPALLVSAEPEIELSNRDVVLIE